MFGKQLLKKFSNIKKKKKLNKIINTYSIQYNMENKTFLKELIIYLINTNHHCLQNNNLKIFKFIIHNIDSNENHLLNYFFNILQRFDKEE